MIFTFSSFSINLQCGPSVNPRDDISLHLSPVFTPPPRVVRNSLQLQQWGPEESFGGFPFVPGQPFEIIIMIESDHYKIAINGQHFAEFRQRIPYHRVNYISIDGDVSLTLIGFEPGTGPYASAPPPVGLNPPPYPTGIPSYPSASASASGYQSAPPPPGYDAGYPQASYPAGPTAAYPQASYPTGAYPSQLGAYPSQPGAYPSQPGAYPSQPGAYQSQPHKSGGILGSALGGTLGGLAAGAAATSIGSKLFGSGHGSGHHSGYPGHHKSSPIPIGKIAAGAGAAALGAAVLTGHHPVSVFLN